MRGYFCNKLAGAVVDLCGVVACASNSYWATITSTYRTDTRIN